MPIRPRINLECLSVDGRQCVITGSLGRAGFEGFISDPKSPLWHKTVWNSDGENQEQASWDLKEEIDRNARNK